MPDRTTLTISIQTHEKLNRLKEKLEEILERNVSLDETLSVVLAVKQIDEVLSDMILKEVISS